MCLISRFLVLLIDVFVNLFFFGRWSMVHIGPAGNALGLWVIGVPVAGGLIVGIMAVYGSKAIRGHGIPEAMEQILTNESRIKPSITFLKPLSAAISIGSGGPFGAEGPIIATGGALGSWAGQLLNTTADERKILLASGATAGMAAIFGSPIAAICLAIELLLFEFSPRSIIPVALACITGAAGHKIFFESAPVFSMPLIAEPTNLAVAIYSGIGVIMGVLSAFTTRLVYVIEDTFEKLPVHWMWWPDIGGVVVGLVGFFAPQTLGVGYENIALVLSGSATIRVLLILCFLKFLSWAIALGSGTSGGTLAPLLTIGGATGALIGMGISHIFPSSEISISVASLVGMAAMFAGASRAVLTSILFALETTGQFNGLLPLIGGSMASYIVSFFMMDTTIMTEKIARRGIRTPDSYTPDDLHGVRVRDAMSGDVQTVRGHSTVSQVRKWIAGLSVAKAKNYVVVIDRAGAYLGVLHLQEVYASTLKQDSRIADLLHRRFTPVHEDTFLRRAIDVMATDDLDVLPVVSGENEVVGVLTHRDVIRAHGLQKRDVEQKSDRKVGRRHAPQRPR